MQANRRADTQLVSFLGPSLEKAMDKVLPSFVSLIDKKIRKVQAQHRSDLNSFGAPSLHRINEAELSGREKQRDQELDDELMGKDNDSFFRQERKRYQSMQG